MHRAVAVLVGVAAPDQADVDGDGLVEEPLLALNIHDLHQVLFRALVQLAAAVPGVHEGVQAHVGDGPDVVGRDVPVHVGDDALGQVIGFQLIGQGQLAQFGGPVPVAANHPFAHALVAKVVASGAIPVALARSEEEGQVPGVSRLHIPLLQGLGQGLGAGAADKPASGDGVAVLDHQRRLFRSDDANFFHAFRTPLLFELTMDN